MSVKTVRVITIVSEFDQEISQSQTMTNPWHHKTNKQNNQLSLPHYDDCKTSIGHKVNAQQTKNNYGIPNWEQQSTTNQQQHNHCLRRDSSQSCGGGGLNAFYWYQIFAIDSVVVKAQKVLSFLTIAMYPYRETN